MGAFDPILFWNNVAIEAQRRDYTFHDALGNDEAGTPMDRQRSIPRQGGPTRTSRALAIVHLAMFDAMLTANPSAFAGFDGLGTYGPRLEPPADVGWEAAVAGAAATTIQILFGGAIVDEALLQFRAVLAQRDQGPEEIQRGLTFGAQVGRALLDARSADRAGTSDPAGYRPFAVPGAFRPDPFMPAQEILGISWGQVDTFGGFRVEDVGPVGPLETLGGASKPPREETIGEYLSAPGWADDLALVRRKGASPEIDGVDRTPEETLIGLFWGYDGVRGIGLPPRLYNQCLREIAIQAERRLTPAENAILFATANLGMADAGIAAWFEKYTYQVARPVTGIRENDKGFGPDDATLSASDPTFDPDLALPFQPTTGAVRQWLDNAPNRPSLVTGDATWAPLGAPQTNTRMRPGGGGDLNRSPGFPAYPSGHATFGTACFEITRRLLTRFGIDPEVKFVVVSDELNGVNVDADGSQRPLHRRTLTLAQAIHENAWSRIYLGVHWRMDAIEGVRLGGAVVDAIARQGRGPAALLAQPQHTS